MFFKRIELIGFKSFARKTVLEFPAGITLIVGPNGCGKSNIFDAVRWVLGEQNARTLRAAKMGEVIFNGTAELKPSNFAQVSLVIDNRSSLLPVEVKEIVITRRLFRDGESQYFINRVPCRLKDIQDLFMDTGIRTEAYSMMEQGEVDFIINARAQERRIIFDEAAGIAKYKARKAEALRKLERTQEDLLRLGDIITEVKRQLNVLKRQANRARYYKELKERMVGVEKVLLCRRGEQVERHLSELSQRMLEREDYLQELKARLAKNEALWQEGQLKIEALQGSVSKGHSAVYGVRSEVAEMKNKCRLNRERIAEYRQRERYYSEENQNISKKLRALEEEQQNLKIAQENLKQELRELSLKKETRKEELKEFSKKSKEYDEGLLKINTEIKNLQDKEMSLNQEVHSQELIKNKLEFQLQERRREGVELAQKILQLRELGGEKEKELKTLEREINKICDDVNKLTAQEKDLRQDFEELTRKCSSSEAEIQGLKAEKELLEELIKNYEGFGPGTKEIIEAAKAGEISEMIDLLSEIIEVKAGFEKAIEAALAEKLQYMLVKDIESGRRILDFLERQRKRIRTVLLPRENPRIKAICGRQVSFEIQQEEVMGWATDFVHCAEEYRGVVETLLSGVLIVEDKEAALRLSAIVNYIIVTRDGRLVVGAAGELIAGSAEPEVVLIGRHRRVAELKKFLRTKGAGLNELRQQTEEKKKELMNTLAALKHLEEEKKGKEFLLSVKKKEQEDIHHHQEETGNKIEEARRNLALLEGEIREAKALISERQDELKAIAEKIAELINEREGRIDATAMAKEDLAALKSELQNIETAEKITNERILGIEEQLRRVNGEIGEARENLAKRERELQELREDKKRQEKELQTTEALIASREAEESGCNERLRSQIAELEQLQLEIKQWQKETQTLQRDRNVVENEVNELKVKRAELNSQLEYLEQQVKEKFGVKLAELKLGMAPVELDNEELQSQLGVLRQRMERLGPINPQALEDYNRQEERYKFLTQQQQDLLEAKESLAKTIKTIDATCLRLFNEAFAEIQQNFEELFRRLFGGGRAELKLVESDDVMEAGVEIIAQPPGKKLSHLALLSGGERALTAIALMFALFLRKPSPFCFLDEIDAPLDDYNVELFKTLLKEFVPDVQFIVITHNKRTMILGNTIYGVTMEEPGITKVVSVSFEEVGEKIPLE